MAKGSEKKYRIDKEAGIRGVNITALVEKSLRWASALTSHGPCRGSNARTWEGDPVLPTDDEAFYFDPAGGLYAMTVDFPVIVLDVAGRLFSDSIGCPLRGDPWPRIALWSDVASSGDILVAFATSIGTAAHGRNHEVVDAAFAAHRQQIRDYIESRREVDTLPLGG